MFGQRRYQPVNAMLNRELSSVRPLIAVHRGTGLGTIAENTSAAVGAALNQGAEMVEVDVVRSTDGEFFMFHTGYEQMHFGISQDMATMSAEEIRSLRYRWCSSAEGAAYPVAGFFDVLAEHPTALFNVDRSWKYWDTLLPELDGSSALGRVVMKSPVADEWLHQLASHPVKYAFAPMVRSHQEVVRVLAEPEINTVGMELLARSPDHEFARPGYVDWLHDQGLFALMNAINLSDRVPLFCGWDDETSVLQDPDAGWGRLMSLGADIIQTDWPGLLVAHRDRQMADGEPPALRTSSQYRGGRGADG